MEQRWVDTTLRPLDDSAKALESEAAWLFRRAIALDPDDAGAHHRLAHTAYRLAKPRNPRHLDGIGGGRKRVSDVLMECFMHFFS